MSVNIVCSQKKKLNISDRTLVITLFSTFLASVGRRTNKLGGEKK